MNHRFSEDDASAGRYRKARAPRRPTSSMPACSPDRFSAGQRQRSFLPKSRIRRPREHHHHRPRYRPRAARCRGRSSRWPAAAPSCCSKTSPNGATPKPASAIWRATTNSPRCPTGVNFRDEIGRLLAIQQGADQLSALLFVDPRPVQAGQRHARPSLRRPAVVRGSPIACAKMLRPEDFVARFGGDEFVVFQQKHPFRRGLPPGLPAASSSASPSATRSTIIWSRSAPASASP